MSLEDFQLLDNEPFDNSIIKRDFIKVYHQQGAQLNQSDQNIEFIFGENNNYHKVGDSYLEFDITVRRNNGVDFDNDDPIRLTNNAFAFVFKEARLSTTPGSDLEHNKYVGQISTIMRSLTSRDGDLLSQFDNINEKIVLNNDGTQNDVDTTTIIQNTSLQEMLINNHNIVGQEVNRGKIKGHLPLEHIFGFCKTFKKITKNLGFHITFKTANLQDIIYTTFADNAANQINVTINNLYLFVPFLIPSTETQLMFNESIQNNYRIFFDEWHTERRVVTDQIYQIDIGSAQSVNSPKYLICAHQTANRADTNDKRNNKSVFDHLNVRKYFIEIDGIRYPRDSVLTNFELNDYLDQYKDVKLFYKEYVGEELLNPFISYPDMKNKYPIQVIDLKHQQDHITPKKIQLFEEYNAIPNNAKLFLVLIRRREIEMISDGNKLIEVKVI